MKKRIDNPVFCFRITYMTAKLSASFFSFLSCFCLLSFSLAAEPPSMSSQERTEQLQRQEKSLIRRIEQEKQKPQIEEQLPPQPAPAAESTEKVLIKNIEVAGATLISEEKIQEIISPFKNKELTLGDMQKVADLITDVYRQRGFITSRAYLPPQKIEEGILEIRVIQGRMGDVQVKGNRYFKTRLLLAKLTLKKGEYFNYNTLRRDLIKINQSPDRLARAVLIPGKAPGETDLILEVKDRLPIHIGLSGDNYGSRYIDKQRYSATFTDNNLLGFDDVLNFQYQFAQAGRYFLKSVRYSLPLKAGWQVGAFGLLSRAKLGQEFEDQDVHGKAQIYGIYATNALVNTENLDLNLNLGFDYKDITNYQLQTVSSQDNLRIGKVGLDMDWSDDFGGRTLLSAEVDIGIPDIMGGLKKASDTTTASRSGAGGNFVKNTVNLLRLQKLPFSSTLLWKNQVQISPYVLTSAEQFQIGGIANVRGYGPAEAVGDSGYYTSFEWSFPVYFIPKKLAVPFSKANFYDALRLAVFYDWATSRLRRPQSTEAKNRTLRSAGCGLRFTLPEDFSLRVDLGWPLDNTPSDSDHLHTWVQVSKDF
ncbi:MAG: ShlB/FhaC/HecB family hemolysin secretion/activation protein [Candidatus Omnitrophica bacterium]|nr:ShlB/FhaC/HecB family hemolysin secretion/activation protein [Candidatus Omnitrophota bacterium]